MTLPLIAVCEKGKEANQLRYRSTNEVTITTKYKIHISNRNFDQNQNNSQSEIGNHAFAALTLDG